MQIAERRVTITLEQSEFRTLLNALRFARARLRGEEDAAAHFDERAFEQMVEELEHRE